MPNGSIGGDVATLRALVTTLRTAALPTWLLPALDPAAVRAELRPRIGEVVPDALDLAEVRLQDVRARRSWALRFEADVVTSDGARTVVLVAERPLPGAEPTPRPGAVLLPGSGLSVVAAGNDPGLPALPTLMDPQSARPVIESALRTRGLPVVGLETPGSRLVRYKPGHRATVVHDLAYSPDGDPSWPRRIITKTYSDDGGSSTEEWMRALWHSELGGKDLPRLAEPLGYLPEHRTLLQRAIPGDRTLADLVTDPTAPPGSLEAALQRTADALVALHSSGVSTGPPRTATAELDTTRRLLGRLAPSMPSAILADAETFAGWLQARMGRPPERTVPVHGAFRPAQVLLDGARPGFLDFDGFGQGEAALDTSRFVAKLVELAGDRSRGRELAHTFLDRYRSEAPLPAERTTLWLVLDLFAGSVRCWYRAQHARAQVLLSLLDDALAADW